MAIASGLRVNSPAESGTVTEGGEAALDIAPVHGLQHTVRGRVASGGLTGGAFDMVNAPM
ncbi:hypothetical protein [Blastomonas sp. UPD001]|uniref:hypothetical protein n=1 Tax=Blastomonas sp. UPD001 TaxID=2217673 RepID=UPI001300B9E8|nr:hypothetical protein [Blastomonas sp. UPD001]MBL0965505.1 hypothetical protein [Blastomonas sp.]